MFKWVFSAKTCFKVVVRNVKIGESIKLHYVLCGVNSKNVHMYLDYYMYITLICAYMLSYIAHKTCGKICVLRQVRIHKCSLHKTKIHVCCSCKS